MKRTADEIAMGLRRSFKEREFAEKHKYRVWVLDTGDFESECRHTAGQHYMAARKRLNDFSSDPAEFKVRIWCDGEEYYNDPTPDFMRSDLGLSIRAVNGTPRRPLYIRVMP